MIKKSSELTKKQRKNMYSPLRGVFIDRDYDFLVIYSKRYSSGIITLNTALAFYGITDDWIKPPFDFCFQTGYRNIADLNVKQFRDNKEIAFIGVDKVKIDGVTFNIYDLERLLIEIIRRKKYLSIGNYKSAVFFYRNKAEKGELNIPKLKEYLSKMPKKKLLEEKISNEIL